MNRRRTYYCEQDGGHSLLDIPPIFARYLVVFLMSDMEAKEALLKKEAEANFAEYLYLSPNGNRFVDSGQSTRYAT